jgi:hypothetical protein
MEELLQNGYKDHSNGDLKGAFRTKNTQEQDYSD